jgi:hypothetical protein
MSMSLKRKRGSPESAESSHPYDENTMNLVSKQGLNDFLPLQSEPEESERKKRRSETDFGLILGSHKEARSRFATQPETINDDVVQRQEQQEQHKQRESDAVKKAEFAVTPVKRLSDATRLSKNVSAVKQLEATTKDVVKQQEKLTERVMKMEQQQDGATKKAVKKALADEVTEAVENAIAAQLSKAVEQAVAKRVPEEVKKVVAEQLPMEVQNVVAEQLPKEVEKIQKKADEAVKKAIAEHNADFKRVEADFKKNAAKELKELRDQLQQSTDSRQKSEKQYDELATLAEELKSTIAAVKEAAEQAAISAKEADEKLQKALEEKEAAESAIASLQEKVDSHNDLLEQQKEQLKRLHHHFGFEPSNLMDLDGPTYAAYPSPNSSEGAPKTPHSWSQSQNSTSRFTSSTSSTTNDGSANDRKPRQAMMWIRNGNANPFTNSTRRKIVDTENIAMENHSRVGYSNDPPSSDESEEELPTSNAPSSQYGQFQSPAEQATGSFGRPTASFSGHFNGAGQLSSHRAPRSTTFQIDYSQQRGHDLSGAERSSSRRGSRSSRADYAPTEERVTYPPRQTPRSRGQTNYAHQQHPQQQHQYANDDLDGAGQSNFRGAATPSRKRTHFDGNDMSEHSQMESGPKRVRFSDNTYQSNFSHPQSQFPLQGRGGSRGNDSGRGRGGNTLRDLAPLNGTPQTPSSYVAPQSHYHNRHTQRGQAPFSNVAQLPSSYEQSPRYDHSGNTPTGPARWRNSTAAQPASSYVASPSHTQGGYTPASQPPTFQEQSSSQERDPYKAERKANANNRISADENLRATQFHEQSQRQQQPQQPQHNGRGSLNRNGRARNGNAEDSRDSQYDNPRYVPPPQSQGPRTFGRPTHASSSRQEEPSSAGVRTSIEDQDEAQNDRGAQQFGKKQRRQNTSSMTQPGAQQTNTPRTPAPSRPQQPRNARAPAPITQSFRDARGLSPEGRTPGFMDEGLSGILASKASASRPLNSNKGPARNSANPTGGDLFSRVTFTPKEKDSSASNSPNGRKGKGRASDTVIPNISDSFDEIKRLGG